MTQQEILMKVNALAEREFDVNECFQQVLTRNRSIYWSWGVSKNASVKDRCILLKVNGHHHKGWVGITLGWMDTFDVHIIKMNGDILETIKDVYVFDLVETKDNRIEKIEAYQF